MAQRGMKSSVESGGVCDEATPLVPSHPSPFGQTSISLPFFALYFLSLFPSLVWTFLFLIDLWPIQHTNRF